MKIRSICYCVILASLFSSCAPSLYFPEKVVTTSFSDKNQVFINASAKPQSKGADSTNRPGNSFSLAASAGYSFAQNLGGYIAYSNVSERTVKEIYQPSIWSWQSITGGIFNGKRYEIGLVYFQKSGKNVLFECAGGYSMGDMKRTSDFRSQRNFDANYFTLFIQPSWGIKKDNVVFSSGIKLWYQQFTELKASASTIELFQSGEKDLTQIPYFFMCPFMNFEAGIRFVKFNTQIGFPLHYRSSNNDPVLYGFPMYLTFGLTFRLEKDIFSDFRKKSNSTNENL